MTARIPIYVINVASHTERLRRIRGRAVELGLDLIRWPATTGADLDPDTFVSGALTDGIRIRDFAAWSGNEAACGVSHIRLLHTFLTSGAGWAVVLEDDAVILRPVPTDIREWYLPADADIVLLNDRSLAGPTETVAAGFSYGKAIGGAGTDGYLISRAGARKLLRVLDPLKDPLDFQMYAHFTSVRGNDRPPFFWRLPRNAEADSVELTAYRIEPPLIGHGGGDSAIGNERHPRARFYCRVLLGLDFDGYSTAAYPSPGPRVLSPPVATAAYPSGRFFKGVDVSHLADDGGCRVPVDGHPLDLLVDAGVDTARISAWVGEETPFGTGRLLPLARAATTRGLDLCVALHFSDTWADPGTQGRPAAWRGFDRRRLQSAVRTYTRDLMVALCRQGTPPSIVQVGNEITNGMLWAGPDQADHEGGRLWRPDDAGGTLDYDRQWAVFADLVRHAVAGVRAAATECGADVEVMVHIDTGAYVEQADWWLRRAREHGIDFDLAGLSFYPMWHEGASIGAIRTLSLLSVTLPDVGVVLAETGYPARVPTDVPVGRPLEFPPTPAGQRDFLAAALRALRAVPTGRGLIWWGGFFLDGADCHRTQALLDADGRPRPALTAFADG